MSPSVALAVQEHGQKLGHLRRIAEVKLGGGARLERRILDHDDGNSPTVLSNGRSKNCVGQEFCPLWIHKKSGRAIKKNLAAVLFLSGAFFRTTMGIPLRYCQMERVRIALDKGPFLYGFTETKKQSPNTGARANNTLHT